MEYIASNYIDAKSYIYGINWWVLALIVAGFTDSTYSMELQGSGIFYKYDGITR